jgi:hypothetical protein
MRSTALVVGCLVANGKRLQAAFRRELLRDVPPAWWLPTTQPFPGRPVRAATS